MKTSIAILGLALLACGCASTQKGENVTASAGHSPVLQIQPGIHLGSANARPVQPSPEAPEGAASKIAEAFTCGSVTVTTTVTVSSGDGGVDNRAQDQGDQTPSTSVTTDAEMGADVLP
jgi:PBP1b-binding outer membrane lipoprotein LpoB